MAAVLRLPVLVASIALATISASVVEADPAPITFADVLAAIPKAPGAQVACAEVSAAEALVDAAGPYPSPTVHVETNRLTARLVTGATIPIAVFGTVGAARDAASAHARVARADAVVDGRERQRRAAIAWIDLARAGGDAGAAAIVAKQSAELERIARGRLDAGSGAEVDVSAAAVARARADLAVSAATRAHQAASADLAGALGWDPARETIASGNLPGRVTIPIETLRGRARVHPDRSAARERIVAAEADLATVRTERFPSLAFEVQVSAFDAGTPGVDVLVGLSLELPLFARVGARARAAERTTAAERARLATLDVELDARLVATYRRWQSALETSIVLERDILPAQERTSKLSAQAYREGARDLAFALQADRDLAAVRAEVNAARADVALAWFAVEEAVGGDLSP